MVRNKVFSFLRGTPPSRFQDFWKYGINNWYHYLIPLKILSRFFKEFKIFTKKKNIVSSELLLHLKNIQCNR